MGRRRDLGIAALLALGTAALFSPALDADFVLYDDPEYVTDNPVVRAGLSADGVRWAFTTFHAANWHPLTWLSHMLDATLYGDAAWGHHLTSVLLHAAATALCYLVFAGWTGAVGRSLLVAALFGAHPLRVESVAWVAERKDVLAAFWWMATLLAYGAWVRRPSAVRYGAVLLGFACGLLAKPMVVTLPFVLLLLDAWPLCRPLGARLVTEKLPLLVLSAAGSVVTFVAQREGGAVVPLESLGLLQRLAGAAVAYATYLWMTVWPVNLAVLYPLRPIGAPEVIGSLAVLGGVSALALRPALRAPAPAVGWLWFLGTLVPVIGLVKVGQQALADRFTYLPQVGLFVAAVWWLGERLGARAGVAVGALAVAAASAGTLRQLAVWQDSVTLFRHALAVTGDNPTAETNLAAALLELGRLDEARPHAERAVARAPGSAEAWITFGRARIQGGDVDGARAAFETASRLDPHDARAHYNLGVVAAEQGRIADAIASYERAIAEWPTYFNAYNNLGNALAAADRLEEAEAALREAVRLDPASPSARANLAIVLERRGRSAEAIAAYRAALALAPNEPMLWFNLAAALSGTGQRAEAIEALEHALRLAPGWEPALAALAELERGGAARD
ncbi:MAG TPA: tetratricopeptide repeat protein [Candidatus Limnocylindria bacterium]|nr:tetratricopeptide repeat protein [Candidatus Limnocylindria bacterium]